MKCVKKMTMNISGIITTLNEENNILECIISLQQICNEVIVIDSGSNDQTVSIAEKAGAKVYHQSYLGDGIQKNVALQYVQNDWVFSLDADERLTLESAKLIENIDLSTSPFYGFAVKRKNFIGSRWIRCCGWYPNYLVRLYNHKKIRFSDVKQHAAVPLGNTQKLACDILHYRYKNIGELFAKPGRDYVNRSAKIIYLKGGKVNFFTPFHHAYWSFIGNYLFRKGFTHGIDGFTLALSIACNTYLKYAKVLEYKRDSKVRENEDFSQIW